MAAADFDRDGDLDLFVGSRVTPGRFPESPPSRLLRNDGGRFVDVAAELAADLGAAGMVTAALWSDADEDGWLDLIVAGHWQPVRLWRNRGGDGAGFAPGRALTSARGLWNGLAAADLDGDAPPGRRCARAAAAPRRREGRPPAAAGGRCSHRCRARAPWSRCRRRRSPSRCRRRRSRGRWSTPAPGDPPGTPIPAGRPGRRRSRLPPARHGHLHHGGRAPGDDALDRPGLRAVGRGAVRGGGARGFATDAGRGLGSPATTVVSPPRLPVSAAPPRATTPPTIAGRRPAAIHAGSRRRRGSGEKGLVPEGPKGDTHHRGVAPDL